MGQVVYTGSISGNHNLNANGSDGVTVYLSRSGEFPASYTVTSATLYLSKFYCYSRSYGIDLYLNGERVNNSEMCGSEVTQKESNGSTSWYSISGTWNLSTGADYEDVSAADIVTRAHSASSTGVMNLRDGCQVKITVEYSEGSGGDDGGDDGGGGYIPPSDSGLVAAENVRLSATESYGAAVKLSWEYSGYLLYVVGMYVFCEISEDGETWEKQIGSSDLKYSGLVDHYDDEPPYSYEYLVWPPTVTTLYKRFRIETIGVGPACYSEYTPTLKLIRPQIEPYTDNPIIAGETHVKATHITELQTRINVIYESGDLPPYKFTEVVAGRTGLSGWSEHVAELRSAIDELWNLANWEHEPWIEFDANSPRADVIEQIRRLVDSIW